MIEQKVVNLRDYRVDGRIVLPPGICRVDRESPWGNPYKVVGDNRPQVLELFVRYARAKLEQDPAWLEPLRGKLLACWCRPKSGFKGKLRCHAQILVAFRDGDLAEEVA